MVAGEMGALIVGLTSTRRFALRQPISSVDPRYAIASTVKYLLSEPWIAPIQIRYGVLSSSGAVGVSVTVLVPVS